LRYSWKYNSIYSASHEIALPKAINSISKLSF
jgi:hypothetical protein